MKFLNQVTEKERSGEGCLCWRFLVYRLRSTPKHLPNANSSSHNQTHVIVF